MSKKWPFILLAVVVPIAITLTELHLIPLAPPVCPFSKFLGIHCPMCGTTRAWRAALGGHWLQAFRLNPLFLGWGLLCGLAYWDLLWRIFRSDDSIGVRWMQTANRPPIKYVLIVGFFMMFLYNNAFNPLLGP